ncbi:MAG: hypothetical protein MR917_00300 [Treponema porcinum]|nr:hypothetical protein [Treponema porcinum]
MKKLLAVLVAAGVAASAAFANVEMTLNLYGTPFTSLVMDAEFDPEIRPQGAFGFEEQFGFFFGSPAKFVDIGMTLSNGLDFFRDAEFYANGEKMEDNSTGFGMNTYLTLGPAARFNIGDMHSFLVSPGLGVNLLAFSDDIDVIGFTCDFNLDLGYRIWIVNKTGFHFGFDVGYDLSVPLAGSADVDNDYTYDVKSGSRNKIYFGIAFNFGDKSPDKFRAE